MDSSLMNDTDTVTSTGLGDKFDNLLRLCIDADTPRGEIGKALEPLVDPHYVEQLGDRPEYWLIRTLAGELYQPAKASRFVASGLARAYACPNGHVQGHRFAKLRIELLQARVNRSGASLGEKLRQDYIRRLAHAKESPYAPRTS